MSNDNFGALVAAAAAFLTALVPLVGIVVLFVRFMYETHRKYVEKMEVKEKEAYQRVTRLETDIAQLQKEDQWKADKLETLQKSHDETQALLKKEQADREEEHRLRLIAEAERQKAEQERDAEREDKQELQSKLKTIESTLTQVQGELQSIKDDREERKRQYEDDILARQQKFDQDVETERTGRIAAETLNEEYRQQITTLSARIEQVELKTNGNGHDTGTLSANVVPADDPAKVIGTIIVTPAEQDPPAA